MDPANGREPVVILVGLEQEMSTFEEVAASLPQRPRVVAASFSEGLEEIMTSRKADLRLIVLGLDQRPEDVLSILPRLRRPDDTVRVPVVVVGCAEPGLVGRLESLGVSSFLELPDTGGKREFLEKGLRYWLTLNLVPLKNR